MGDSDALQTLVRDLTDIFGARLGSLVSYGARVTTPKSPVSTLAVVDRLSADDLRACAARARAWHGKGLATPLLLGASEFGRSLDAFPFEFGAILDDYTVVSGNDPLQGMRVDVSDLRRVCEVQIRSHLLHLREAYIETFGQDDALASLITRSAAPLAALLRNLERLHGAPPVQGVLSEVARLEDGSLLPAAQARALFPGYLTAIEELTAVVDRWSDA